MKQINKPLHICTIDDFPPKMVRKIDIKRTKFENILTYGGNRDTTQAGGLLPPTLRKRKKDPR